MELKECPFCGSGNVSAVTEDDYGLYWWVVACGECDAVGPRARDRDEAVKKWNWREVVWGEMVNVRLKEGCNGI